MQVLEVVSSQEVFKKKAALKNFMNFPEKYPRRLLSVCLELSHIKTSIARVLGSILQTFSEHIF